MNKKYKILLAMLFTMPILSACGPYYHYEYTAPSSKHGKKCVTQCMEIRERCEESCDWQEQSCKDRASHADKSERLGDDISCSFKKSSCTDRCLTHYQHCYTDCGGTVTRVKEE